MIKCQLLYLWSMTIKAVLIPLNAYD